MKKYFFIGIVLFCNCNVIAQFDIILDRLGSLGDTFLDASQGGQLFNAVEDARRLREAILLVNGAICMLDDFEYQQPDLYLNIENTSCTNIPTDFEVSRKILDNSLLILGKELVKVGQRSAFLLLKVLKKGDKEPSKPDYNLVSDVMEKVKQILIAEIKKNFLRRDMTKILKNYKIMLVMR